MVTGLGSSGLRPWPLSLNKGKSAQRDSHLYQGQGGCLIPDSQTTANKAQYSKNLEGEWVGSTGRVLTAESLELRRGCCHNPTPAGCKRWKIMQGQWSGCEDVPPGFFPTAVTCVHMAASCLLSALFPGWCWSQGPFHSGASKGWGRRVRRKAGSWSIRTVIRKGNVGSCDQSYIFQPAGDFQMG